MLFPAFVKVSLYKCLIFKNSVFCQSYQWFQIATGNYHSLLLITLCILATSDTSDHSLFLETLPGLGSMMIFFSGGGGSFLLAPSRSLSVRMSQSTALRWYAQDQGSNQHPKILCCQMSMFSCDFLRAPNSMSKNPIWHCHMGASNIPQKAKKEFCISLRVLLFHLVLSTLGNILTISPVSGDHFGPSFSSSHPLSNLSARPVSSVFKQFLNLFLSRTTVPTLIYATVICWNSLLAGLSSPLLALQCLLFKEARAIF